MLCNPFIITAMLTQSLFPRSVLQIMYHCELHGIGRSPLKACNPLVNSVIYWRRECKAISCM